MKKLFFLTAILILTSVILFSCKKKPAPEPDPTPQEDTLVSCSLNIDNGCLSNWRTTQGLKYTYPEPCGHFLYTLNELMGLPEYASGPGPQTTFKSTDFYVGPYAAMIQSSFIDAKIDTSIVHIFIPGILGSTTLSIPEQTIYTGKPYTQTPYSFCGYYKYTPVSGDSGCIIAMIHKYNTGTHKRDTLAYGKMVIKNTVSAYTPFEVVMNYSTTGVNPDSCTVLMASSAGFTLTNVFGCQGQIGSTLFIDEIFFKMSQ